MMVFHVDGKRLLLLWLWLVSTTLCEFANRLDDALDDGDAPEDFPKDGRSWDVGPTMEGGPITEY